MFGRKPNSNQARIRVLRFSANREWLVSRFCILYIYIFLRYYKARAFSIPTIKHRDYLFGLPGYNLVVKSRLHKRGGGVGIFLLGVYDYTLRDDVLCDNVLPDTVFIEIPDSVVIGCVYKPPMTMLLSSLLILTMCCQG